MNKRIVYSGWLCVALWCWLGQGLWGQQLRLPQEMQRQKFASDSVQTEDVPEGIYVWHIDPRFGTRTRVEVDTVSHLFQNRAYTDGMKGEYNYLGNLGAPRVSRLYVQQGFDTFEQGQFVFGQPYGYFLKQTKDIYFTNTKSPFTNLTYHECGNKQNGEDHFSALFAVNVNKQAGFGASVDYNYGRGYYANQSTAQLNATFFGSYIGERYAMNAYYSNNHIKTRENGGIENDDYVTRPETFPTKFQTHDIPTRLERVYNKMHLNTLYMTQRYNLGFRRYRNAKGEVVKLMNDTLHESAGRGMAALVDTTAEAKERELAAEVDTAMTHEKLEVEFVPVVGFIHTVKWDNNNRNFLDNDGRARGEKYFANYFLPGDQTDEEWKYAHVGNLLGLELTEGFNRWVKTGMRLYAAYDYYKYTMPGKPSEEAPEVIRVARYSDHYVSLGAELYKRKGRFFRYGALGEVRSNGENWGEMNVKSHFDFDVPLGRKDSLAIRLKANVKNEQPNFYMRHFHGMNAWWDKDLENVWRAELGAELSYKHSRVRAMWQNVKNYTYLQSEAVEEKEGLRYAAGVAQKGGAMQVLSLAVGQDVHWGPWHWENEVTLQKSSDEEVLPLPLLNVWSNMYFKFKIAKVLKTEIGADVRFFTKYYAPNYLPMVGLFGVQEGAGRTEIGAYPIVNAYVNFDLKRTRFYVALSHVNAKKGSGEPFLLPHYPMNEMLVRLGISWNFVN